MCPLLQQVINAVRMRARPVSGEATGLLKVKDNLTGKVSRHPQESGKGALQILAESRGNRLGPAQGSKAPRGARVGELKDEYVFLLTTLKNVL